MRISGPFRYRRYRFTEIATKKWTRSMGRDTQRINCGLCIQPVKYSEMSWPLARREQTSCTDLVCFEWVQSVNGSLRFEIRLRSRYSRKSWRHRAVNGFPACSPRLGQAYVPMSNRVRVARIEDAWTEHATLAIRRGFGLLVRTICSLKFWKCYDKFVSILKIARNCLTIFPPPSLSPVDL